MFICTVNVEQVVKVDEMEELNFAKQLREIEKDDKYQELISDFKNGDNPITLPEGHPVGDWASSWELISLSTEQAYLVIDGTKMIVSAPLQTKIVSDMHKETHGSYDQIKVFT